MSRRKKTTDLATKLAGAAGGFVAAKMLNSVTFIGENPYIASGVKIAAGVVLNTSKTQGIVKDAGMGMAVAGVTELMGNFISLPDPTPPVISGLINGFPRSYRHQVLGASKVASGNLVAR